ncbi:MAG: hypothetical protein PVI00_03830 [Desulfobacterales bacterium]
MKRVAVILGIIFLLPQPGSADIIFFKDGMKTVCQEKAWEEGKEVNCEYEGTVLSYQKKDVLRIQRVRTQEKEKPAAPAKTPAEPKPAATVTTPAADVKAPASKPLPPDTGDQKVAPIQPTSVSNTKGLEFYNPRRPQKYWTSAVSKHQTFKEAIAALANQYERSPDWIEQQMGETNDLGEIHRNLARSKSTAPIESKPQIEIKASDTLFYDPRRQHKYWTSATAKHETFQEAVAALSAAYSRPQQWVQQHMGESNSLNEIHQNLKNQKLSESSP